MQELEGSGGSGVAELDKAREEAATQVGWSGLGTRARGQGQRDGPSPMGMHKLVLCRVGTASAGPSRIGPNAMVLF